jgi:hypothetical protein
MVLPALSGIADSFHVPPPERPPESVRTFRGPIRGNDADAEMLARSCWTLALLTEVHRGGPLVAVKGPLGQFRARRDVSSADLLALTPPAGVDQLA